jgi:hypothetical protein
MHDVVSFPRQMVIQYIEKPEITRMPGRSPAVDHDIGWCLNAGSKCRGGNPRVVAALTQCRRQIDRVSLGAAASGICMENGQKYFQR